MTSRNVVRVLPKAARTQRTYAPKPQSLTMRNEWRTTSRPVIAPAMTYPPLTWRTERVRDWTAPDGADANASAVNELPPRILLVMPEHWPRALLRAELLERGHDTVGAPGLRTALLVPTVERDRGPVRLLIIDHAAIDRRELRLLELLLENHHQPRVLLLARPTLERPPGPWAKVLDFPVTVNEIATEAGRLLADQEEGRR